MSDATALQILHWYWVAILAVFGLALIKTSGELGLSSRVSRMIRTTDCETGSRIREVLRKRIKLEQLSPAFKIIPGCVSLAAAAIAAFTPVQPFVLYSFVLLILACSMAFSFRQLRNRQPVRVAVLAHRSPQSVIPPVWFALAIVQGAAPLAALTIAGGMLSAIFVSVSTFACAALAWRVTEMPALLAGSDLPVEQFVDARLRLHRAASVLMLAFVQSFIFLTQMNAYAPNSIVQTAVYGSLAIWLVYSVWITVTLLRKVQFTQAAA
jgi:hypothetical protein